MASSADAKGNFADAREPRSKAELRQLRRLKADNYRKHFLLPRYVDEPDGSKRKLEPGEYHPESRLYPISTPINDLSDFGIGLSMYFKTTLWLGCLMIICALIQTPVATYFNSNRYDEYNRKDNYFVTIGSASCADERVVCLDENCTSIAGSYNFPNGMRRDSNIYVDDESSVLDGVGTRTPGSKQCKVRRFFGSVDLAMMLFIAAVLLYLAWEQDREAEALDLSEQTAQDYSIIVEDPNPEVVDPDDWEKFFRQFGDIFMVTVTLDNGKLMRLYKKKFWIMNEMRLEAIEESQYKKMRRRASSIGEKEISELEGTQRQKSMFKRLMETIGLDKTLEHFYYLLAKVNRDIDKHKHRPYKACKVFVIFNHEDSQRKCLDAMSVGMIPAALDWKDQIDDKYLYNGNLLHIKEAPEPSDLIYENLDIHLDRQLIEQLISWSLVAVLLIVTYYSVAGFFNAGQDVLGALMISFWNGILPEVNRVLVQTFESHHTYSDVEDSFLAKTVACRWFTSSLILYILGVQDPDQFLTVTYITKVQNVLLADALTNPIIRLCDFGGNTKRYILAPLSGTDARARAWNEGTDWLLAERYTDLAKTLLMSLFYSAILPVGYWYSALACFISFWVDKYCVLRLFRQKPPSGDKLVRITRTNIAVIILIHSVVTAHFYYGWPFDGLCPTSQFVTQTGLDTGLLGNVTSSRVYKKCDHVSSDLLPPGGDEDWFQGDGQQEDLVTFYRGVSVFILVYVCVVYFGQGSALSVYSLFFYRHKPVGTTIDILFDTVESGEGYVPGFNVKGLHHQVICCACRPPPGGGKPDVEFDYYLLNWTASKQEVNDAGESVDLDLSEEEKVEIYHQSNVYFDDQLEGLDPKLKNNSLLARAKQYIKNEETARAGEFRKSIEGRVEFRRSVSIGSPREGRSGSLRDLAKLQKKHESPKAEGSTHNESHVEDLMKQHEPPSGGQQDPEVDVESVYPKSDDQVEGKQD